MEHDEDILETSAFEGDMMASSHGDLNVGKEVRYMVEVNQRISVGLSRRAYVVFRSTRLQRSSMNVRICNNQEDMKSSIRYLSRVKDQYERRGGVIPTSPRAHQAALYRPTKFLTSFPRSSYPHLPLACHSQPLSH